MSKHLHQVVRLTQEKVRGGSEGRDTIYWPARVVGETTNAVLKLIIAVNLPWDELKSAKAKGDQTGANIAASRHGGIAKNFLIHNSS